MGWLHATPKSRGRKVSSSSVERSSRLSALQKEGRRIDLPPVHIGAYVLEKFLDVGPSSVGASGPVAISYTEIQAWESCTGSGLYPWEARMLRKLSKLYVVAVAAGEDPMAPPPYTDIASVRRDKVSEKVSTAMRGFMKKGVRK